MRLVGEQWPLFFLRLSKGDQSGLRSQLSLHSICWKLSGGLWSQSVAWSRPICEYSALQYCWIAMAILKEWLILACLNYSAISAPWCLCCPWWLLKILVLSDACITPHLFSDWLVHLLYTRELKSLATTRNLTSPAIYPTNTLYDTLFHFPLHASTKIPSHLILVLYQDNTELIMINVCARSEVIRYRTCCLAHACDHNICVWLSHGQNVYSMVFTVLK